MTEAFLGGGGGVFGAARLVGGSCGIGDVSDIVLASIGKTNSEEAGTSADADSDEGLQVTGLTAFVGAGADICAEAKEKVRADAGTAAVAVISWCDFE